MLIGFVGLQICFAGCAFLQEATRYTPPTPETEQQRALRQDPCHGQADYWGCRQYLEQQRANQINTFNAIRNATAVPVYQPAPIQNTNCTPTYGGGMNCTTY